MLNNRLWKRVYNNWAVGPAPKHAPETEVDETDEKCKENKTSNTESWPIIKNHILRVAKSTDRWVADLQAFNLLPLHGG